MSPARPLDRSASSAHSARRGPDHSVALSIVLTDDEPPSEFRIFTAGKVVTTKGTFTFDGDAAKSVMTEFAKHGIDLMVDYDHASLGVGIDPALSGKAAGWFQPEVRAGELWAVNVRWTPPAAEALRRKEWRFMSPAFELKDGRITSLLNVALTNLPATRQLEPLMAANTKGTTIMASAALSPKLVQSMLDAVKDKNPKAALELLPQLLGELLGLAAPDPDATTEDAPPPAGDGGADEGTEAPTMSDPAKDPKMAASRFAMALTGKSNAGEAMAELARTYKLAAKLDEEKATLAKDRAAIESTERHGLVASLVKLGFEMPFTAWSDDEGKVPCERLAKEPLADLRTRVAKLSANGVKPKTPAPPSGGSSDASGLSETELAMCKQMGCDPATYKQLKAQRDGASSTTAGV